MDQSYFTRSRAGCGPCKRSRVKCDERRPLCSRCVRLGYQCGFTKQLRWIDEPTVKKQPGLRKLILDNGHDRANHHVLYSPRDAEFVSKRIPRILLPPSLCFTRPHDRMAFDHWITTLREYVCVDLDGSYDLHTAFVSMVCEPDSSFLPVLLAYVASHLAAIGIIEEVSMIYMDQRALAAMLRLLQSVSPGWDKTEPQGPRPVPDNIITTAMLLASTEILRGSPNKKLHTLLHGVKALLLERHRHWDRETASLRQHPKDYMEESTVIFKHTASAFIYVDVLTGLPCSQAPVMQDREWYYQSSKQNVMSAGAQFLDPLTGYCSNIFEILGDSRILIEKRLQGVICAADYLERSIQLLSKYDETVQNLPQKYTTTDASNSAQSCVVRLRLHNDSVSAAVAHGLACKIYLLRATDYTRNEPKIARLVEHLRNEVLQIPVESSVITIMLWPLWVLGCESYQETETRSLVYKLMSDMYEKEHILNIDVCLRTMVEQIWTLDSTTQDGKDLKEGTTQSAWVRYCWDNAVKLTFA